MASISAGTRNLKFMQRGKQLPPNPSTPAAAQASSVNTSTPSAQTPVRTPQTAAADSSIQEEEEQWVLPSRIRASKGKGKPPPNTFSNKDSARPRVIVVNEPSYLSFVGADSGVDVERGQDSEDDDMNGGGVVANGRLSFGTLPAKETLDTSIVDVRDKMSHAKAITTSADRFSVFASTGGDASSSSSRRKENGEETSRRRESHTEQRRPTKEPQSKRETSEKAGSSSTSARPARQGFLRPSNYDDIPHTAPRGKAPQQPDDTPTSSKRNGKKRKSDQRTGDGEEEDDVLAQGARARGKRSKKQGKGERSSNTKTRGKAAEMDEDAMAAEIAGGAVDDDEVERYLEGVMQEMRDD